MTGPSVRFEAVAKSYDGGASLAVRDVSLSVEAGSFVALVGESGSGKSTLLKTVNRLIDPSAGRVFVGDQRVEDETPAKLRRHIGYVFQNIGLFPHMTVAENIAIIARLGEPMAVDTGALLDLVGLPRDFATRLPAELSGGEQQRVGVARALAGEPGLMLMDEPFGALDPITRDQLGEAYRELHDRLGLTTILVTHDMAEALLLADRILVMSEGAIVADETPGALFAGAGGEEASALMAVPKRHIEKLGRLGSGAT